MSAALKLVPTEPRLYLRGQVDYASIDAANFSTLKHFSKSPLHYRHALSAPHRPTQPMRLGDAAHTSTLEPVRFTRDYAVYEPPPPDPQKKPRNNGVPKLTKAPSSRRGTKAWDAFAQSNEGKVVLKEAEFNSAMRIRDAVRGSALAMRYLRHGDAEVTLVWQDKETGVWCKCRVDFISQSVPGVIAELKTARDVSPWAFQSAYATLKYHAQAAMQCDALEAILGTPVYHKCIAVESGDPHDVVVYDVIGEPLELGQQMYREWLAKLVECRRDDDWPGYSAGAEVSLSLPAWAVPDEVDDIGDLGLEF